MMTTPPGLPGPHPKYAVVPVLLVFGLLGWVAANNPAPSAAAADVVAVVAMKPIEGRDEVPAASDSPAAPDADRARVIRTAAGLPVELLYGVPSPATMHAWSPRR